MKKANLLSRAEMKKITGGDPPTVWICYYYDIASSCHNNSYDCYNFCNGHAQTCVEYYGYCD